MMVSMSRRSTATQTAAERLEAVRAEIAELAEPLPPATSADADVAALADQLSARTHRHQALLLMVPALERAALVEQLPAIQAEIDAANEAWLAAGELAREVQEREQEIIAERVAAVGAAHAAELDRNRLVGQLEQLDEALRRHDEIYRPPAEPDPATVA